MSLDQQIKEIVSQYEKHGWNLSRVLLSRESREKLGEELSIADATIIDADVDAAWFTRSSNPGQITWELRTISGTPFALLDVFEDSIDDESREVRLKDVENRLLESHLRRSVN